MPLQTVTVGNPSTNSGAFPKRRLGNPGIFLLRCHLRPPRSGLRQPLVFLLSCGDRAGCGQAFCILNGMGKLQPRVYISVPLWPCFLTNSGCVIPSLKSFAPGVEWRRARFIKQQRRAGLSPAVGSQAHRQLHTRQESEGLGALTPSALFSPPAGTFRSGCPAETLTGRDRELVKGRGRQGEVKGRGFKLGATLGAAGVDAREGVTLWDGEGFLCHPLPSDGEGALALMDVMLRGRSLYGASCLPTGTGDLMSHLPTQGKPGSRPWVPLRPPRRGFQANGCCWRRGPLSLAEDGARPLKLVPLPGQLTGGRGEEDGSVGPGRPGLPVSLTAHGEGWCPTRGAPATGVAEGGSRRGPDTEVGGGLHDFATEIESGSCRGAGPLKGVVNGLHDGAGPCTEVAGGSCHIADSLSKVEHGFDPGPVAQNGLSHKAGFSVEADGVGQIEEKAQGAHDRAGPRVEPDAEPCHGASSVSDCYQRAELNCEPCHGAGWGGSSQDNENYVVKDGTSAGPTELQEQRFMLRGIEDGDEQATEMACLSETHPCTAHKHCSPASGADLHPTGLVTTTTAGKDDQAPGATLQQSGEPEEAGDDFGTFEKAGNLVLWAEPVSPLWPEDERLFGQCGNTAAKNQEAGKDTDHHQSWGPWPENLKETAQHRPSLHGSPDGAVESWESRSPHPSPSLTSGNGWVAFDGACQGSDFNAFSVGEQELGQCGAGEQWWPASPPVSAASEPSPIRGYLQSVLRSCFPTDPSTSSSQAAFPTLEGVLSGAEERGGEELSSSQARELWASLQDTDEAVGLKHTRAGCRSHRLLLASLQVDPANMDLPAGQTVAPGSSPQFPRERKAELDPSAVAVGPDSRELTLIKNSFPQHQSNGFSPSHRIQAFFYHWAQTDRSGRCKAPYDINKNFMA